jgi:DNA topoisomerase-2
MLTPIQHILKRPEMYLGSSNTFVSFVFDPTSSKIQSVPIGTSIDGYFIRLFVEVLSNAIDNFFRSQSTETPQTLLSVTVEPHHEGKTFSVSVTNNGNGIPVLTKNITTSNDSRDDSHDMYIPEMIFGYLHSSSNYDDEAKRKTSGLNGIGVKLCNIFSKEFSVEVKDKDRGLEYSQTWNDNMTKCAVPIIKKRKTIKENSTTVRFVADETKIQINSAEVELIMAYVHKLCIDTSVVLGGLPVVFNGQKVTTKNISAYVKNFELFEASDFIEHLFVVDKDNRYQFALVANPSGSTTNSVCVSFVNGINTSDGGSHVDLIGNFMLQYISTKCSKKDVVITPKTTKNYFHLVVVADIVNPRFSTQTKTKLSFPRHRLTSTIESEIQKKVDKVFAKWPVFKEIMEHSAALQDSLYKRSLTDASRLAKGPKRRQICIENYDHANKAGTTEFDKCHLLIVEGLSAKNYAVQGLKHGLRNTKFIDALGARVSGRDYLGIYPLRGKMLNVRNASKDSIVKNKEIQDLIQILNLRFDCDYTLDENYRTLNYGGVMILTDQDLDGLGHITGLIINFLDTLFPSVLKRKGFLHSMLTPIIKIKSRVEVSYFFDEYEADDYIYANKVKGAQYLKGLGSSNAKDIEENFGNNIVAYAYDTEAQKKLEEVFNSKKEFVDIRKDWLTKYERSYIDFKQYAMNISYFIDRTLIRFSLYDCLRSIACFVDGCKVSQRKVLYTLFKKGGSGSQSNSTASTVSTIKVAQLASMVAAETHYLHGEQNLADTIVKMAQSYVGTNNIPLLVEDGNFGSRVNGQASSSRYIFTKLQPYAWTIFNKDDFDLLERNVQDGDEVEYKFMLPSYPVILCNGSVGIGTGHSSSIPLYDPDTIKEYTRTCITDPVAYDKLPECTPHCKGFEGTIEQDPSQSNRFIVRGTTRITKKGVSASSNTEVLVTEIPFDITIDAYKNRLDDLYNKKLISGFTNNSTHTKPNFLVLVPNSCVDHADVRKNVFDLHTYITTTNMVLLDHVHQKPIKFSGPKDIIKSFCAMRKEFYEKRREHKLARFADDLVLLENKHRFLDLIMKDEITVYKKSEAEIVRTLREQNFADVNKDGFQYLLQMQIRSFTTDRMAQLQKEIANLKTQKKKLEKTSSTDLWLGEL